MYLSEIEKIDDILDTYKAIICDIWGVLHNGVTLHQDAIAALRRARAKGKYVILLTNAPKCSDIIQARFAKMGAKDIFWDDTVTSGDTVNAYLIASKERPKIFHWGPDEDRGLYKNTEAEFTIKPEQADFIICTGLTESETEISAQEIAMLDAPARKKIPFLCANPDRSVKIGESFVLCAGSLADIYLKLGGPVEFFGKPYPAVYQRCFQLLQNLDPEIQIQDILAVGDGLQTDIKGAQNMALNVAMIKGGLHKDLFDVPPEDSFTILRETCEQYDVMPEYVMDMLR
ncbi:MAG: TIGR01459 family HAD-type hydrolase [Pseudomonadota bacterium]